MMAHDAESGNSPSLASLPDSLLALARQAAADGLAAHEAEAAIFKAVLDLGKEAFALFLRLSGTGDLGEEVALDDASKAFRLPEHHARPCRSVFGDFSIIRACYGSREGQRIVFVPLDARLRLPEGGYSYLLQGWDAALGSECAFARVAETLERVIGVKQPVDSLERNIRHMAGAAEAFRETRPLPAPEEEGEVFVASAD
ncbi:MAG: hypothetical protein K2W96_19165, partial [Gemmataceae bacterium]|nr:hypothetical protein [Gemmataceae bacterium]